ncbi:MAG: hypothetical protein V3T17_03590 [Pseudomonadales bacterium]
MNATGCAPIPRELCYWITCLTKALAPFIELLIGAMLMPADFVTESYWLLDIQRHWTSYYQWLEVASKLISSKVLEDKLRENDARYAIRY